MARSAAAKYKNEVNAPVKLPVTKLMNKYIASPMVVAVIRNTVIGQSFISI